jgi:hypothetical protein
MLPIVATTRHAPAARCRIADNAPARLARCPLRRPPATPTGAARFLGRNVSASPRKRGKRDDAVVAWGQAAARPRRAVWCRLSVFTDKRNSGPRTIPAQTTKASRRSKKTDCADGSKYDVKEPRTTPAWKVRSFSLRSQRAVRHFQSLVKNPDPFVRPDDRLPVMHGSSGQFGLAASGFANTASSSCRAIRNHSTMNVR